MTANIIRYHMERRRKRADGGLCVCVQTEEVFLTSEMECVRVGVLSEERLAIRYTPFL